MCVECVNHYKQPLKYMGDWYNFFKSVMQLITVLLWVGCILKCSITWRLNFITRANEWSSFFVANHKDIIYLVWRHKVTIFIIQGEDWKMYLLLVQKVTKPLFLFLAGFFAMMWTKRKGNTVLLLFQVKMLCWICFSVNYSNFASVNENLVALPYVGTTKDAEKAPFSN